MVKHILLFSLLVGCAMDAQAMDPGFFIGAGGSSRNLRDFYLEDNFGIHRQVYDQGSSNAQDQVNVTSKSDSGNSDSLNGYEFGYEFGSGSALSLFSVNSHLQDIETVDYNGDRIPLQLTERYRALQYRSGLEFLRHDRIGLLVFVGQSQLKSELAAESTFRKDAGDTTSLVAGAGFYVDVLFWEHFFLRGQVTQAQMAYKRPDKITINDNWLGVVVKF